MILFVQFLYSYRLYRIRYNNSFIQITSDWSYYIPCNCSIPIKHQLNQHYNHQISITYSGWESIVINKEKKKKKFDRSISKWRRRLPFQALFELEVAILESRSQKVEHPRPWFSSWYTARGGGDDRVWVSSVRITRETSQRKVGRLYTWPPPHVISTACVTVDIVVTNS